MITFKEISTFISQNILWFLIPIDVIIVIAFIIVVIRRHKK